MTYCTTGEQLSNKWAAVAFTNTRSEKIRYTKYQKHLAICRKCKRAAKTRWYEKPSGYLHRNTA